MSTPTAIHQEPLQQPLYPISTTHFYCLRSMHMTGNRDCSCPSVFLLVLLINCLSQTIASQSGVHVLLAAREAKVLQLPGWTYSSYQKQFYTCQRTVQNQRSIASPKSSWHNFSSHGTKGHSCISQDILLGFNFPTASQQENQATGQIPSIYISCIQQSVVSSFTWKSSIL